MDSYRTKSILYKAISQLREYLCIDGDTSFPINLIDICRRRREAKLDYMNFVTKGLRGISVRDDCDGSNDIIILDGKQTIEEKNFYCGHEMIHLYLHREEKAKTFHCYESVMPSQNKFLEWQANEGAAEILVPYKIFIPLYVDLSLKHRRAPGTVIACLSQIFGVTEAVIQNRIKNLQYEIYQFFELQTPVEQIQVKSHRQLKREELSHLSAKHPYCLNCLSILKEGQAYCPVCGQSFDGFKKLTAQVKGIEYMVYKSLETEETGRLIFCPSCGKRDLGRGDDCMFCGTSLTNQCSGMREDGGAASGSCGARLTANARYCCHCGSESTYLRNGFLQPWNQALPQEEAQELDLAAGSGPAESRGEEDPPF